MTAAQAAGVPGLQVWLADLDTLAPTLEAIETTAGLLSPDERAWPALGPAASRTKRRLARIALRVLLERSGATEARGVPFQLDGHGKPQTASGQPHFNASHCRHMGLFALAPRGPLGIDIELDRNVGLGPERRALIEAAGLAMASTAGRGMPSIEHSASNAAFLQAWTCLEAFAKARGNGIGALLTDLGITAAGARSLQPGEAARRATALVAASGLAVAALELPEGTWGTIAAPRDLLAGSIRVQALEPDGAQRFELPVTASAP